MVINDSVFKSSEITMFRLRELYLSYSFRPYKMSKFEEYDLYANNKDFLVSDNVITFTDTSGKLMALKPDVTLSIIKNSADAPSEIQKVFYDENVYRVSKGTGSFSEIKQAGVECFGKIGEDEIVDVLTLATKSMELLPGETALSVSDLDIVSSVIAKMCLSKEDEKKLYIAIAEKNLHETDSVLAKSADKTAAEILGELISLHGDAREVIAKLDNILTDDYSEVYGTFKTVILKLSEKISGGVTVDFTVTGDVNYYNGIVFRGFVKGIPTAVLSGGQYDRLMKKLGRKSSAVGFAVYTDALDRVSDDDETLDDGYVNVALPKGRLGEKVYSLFAEAGFECPSILEENRKLIFENPETGMRYFWVKPSDVAIYVERGAADIGVAGKDILLEYEPDVYELLDIKRGKCKMAVAAPKTFEDDTTRTLRVATKFQNIAKSYYRSMGRDIDIIHLNGSIEIAPILGLSDVIVDIVETGTTLRENDLEVFADIVPISARLIANKSSFKFKSEKIEKITEGLRRVVDKQ